ncbi:U1 small nuclear ribonucleoprotein A-like [Bradysia coprophila]|uniref:U1 small nuclear ribonucleoprotein A-like n=1 Tax=Bradysia coprophila TaxID=38358 RepID=UPI00187D6FC1|nr:U1 small nuclear ribonucleoprotein A-like [Bradysia coprophila]
MANPPNKMPFIGNLPNDVAKASNKKNLRCQAFVRFEQIQHAITSKIQLQSFPVYGKPTRIGFARKDSLRNDGKKSKKKKTNSTEKPAETVVSIPRTEPQANKTLYVRRLPKLMLPSELSAMFTHLPGFKEIRRVPNRSDMVFVEFQSVEDSTHAKQHLLKVKLPGAPRDIQVEYARK